MLTIENLITRVSDLTPLSSVYFRLRELEDDARSSAEDIALALSHEPALTARILRMANSAYFNKGSPADSVTKAVNLLGLKRITTLALASSTSGALGKLQCTRFDPYDFWCHSVITAITAQHLGRLKSHRELEVLFVCGLLHNVGHLILGAEAPDALEYVLDEAEAAQQNLYIVERRHLGFDSAALGSSLLRFWQLPPDITEVIAQQNELLSCDQPESHRTRAAIVHIASRVGLAVQQSGPCLEPHMLYTIEPWALSTAGLDLDGIADAAMAADDQFMEVLDSLLPPDVAGGYPVGSSVRKRIPA